jgi:SecD/SecF fusion protein
MQNKGFVRVFAILLALVCIFYLSFSFVTNKYNKEAAVYANEDAAKETYYLDSLANKKVWLGYTLKQCRENEVTLGLDLKGGMNIILELNVPDVIRSLSNNNPDENFNKALDAAYARQASSQRGFLDLFVEEYKKSDQGARLSAIFSTFELKDKITPQSTDDEALTVLRAELKSAIDNSFNVLRTRIDRFGVVSPNIQRLETDGRILVELPGVKEPERVRKLLQGSANLEFWETYDLTELYQALNEIDASLARTMEETAQSEEVADINETTNVEQTTDDDQAVSEPKSDETPTDELLAQTDSDVDSLLNQLGANEEGERLSDEELAKQHPLFSVLMPNVYNGQIMPGPVVGFAAKQDMAKVDSLLNMRQVKDLLPNNVLFKWAVKARDENEQYFDLYVLKVTNRDGSPALSGDVVTDATADFAQDMMSVRAEQMVSMSMNAEGAKAWARLTKENIGKYVAIVLDDLVYSAPRVNDEITGGQSRITGDFTVEEAKDLANVLNSGKMAASVNIVQEDVVGPSLGQEAINAGVISFIVALVILMIYMCAIYGLVPGMVANGALILNIFFTLGILASFKAVLTLPGIAGMVLTLGMAVDANVLIYERTKEELRSGKQMARALGDGYGNAFSAIFDANLTTMIAGIVLFVFGTGPIKGFAWTLLIGISVSFLTAVFLTRLVYEWMIAKEKVKDLTFTTSVSKKFLVNPRFNFLSKRRVGYLIPFLFIVLGSVSMMTIGLNTGIDFTGGRNYVIRFDQDQDVRTDDLRSALDDQLDGSVSVITIGTANQVRVSTNYKIADNDPAVDDEINNKLYEGVKEYLPAGTTVAQFTDQYIQSSQKVGPSMADDIKNRAVMAVIIAMFCMALYILIRFRDWGFSIGVFVSVLVTTLCIIAFYTLLWKILPFSMEVDQTFIAAILTVIGYSINDTVVVFDRIREMIKNYPKRDRFQVVNDALNSTLSRTFNTTLSTFVVVLCIFLLGGATIRSFTFAIMLGVLIGTYSTLFVATPIAYEIQKRRMAKKTALQSVTAGVKR